MKNQVIALAAVLTLGLTAQAEGLKFRTSPNTTAEAQITAAAQIFVIQSVAKELDFAKADHLRQAGRSNCETKQAFRSTSFITICSIPLESDHSTFEAKVRLVTKGTHRGIKQMARLGLSLPTEMKVSYSEFCRSPHLTVTNTVNNLVVLSEAGDDCSMLTTEID